MKQIKPEALVTPQHGGVIIAVDDDHKVNSEPTVKCLKFHDTLSANIGQYAGSHDYLPKFQLHAACRSNGWGELTSKIVKYYNKIDKPSHLYSSSNTESLVNLQSVMNMEKRQISFNVTMNCLTWDKLTSPAIVEIIQQKYTHLFNWSEEKGEFPEPVKIYIITHNHVSQAGGETQNIDILSTAAADHHNPILYVLIRRREKSAGVTKLDENSFEIELGYSLTGINDTTLRKHLAMVNVRFPCHGFIKYLTSPHLVEFNNKLKRGIRKEDEEEKEEEEEEEEEDTTPLIVDENPPKKTQTGKKRPTSLAVEGTGSKSGRMSKRVKQT